MKMSEAKIKCLTRSKASELGLTRSRRVEIARGYSIVSLPKLNGCIQQSAICGRCKNRKSRLSLLENTTERKGLAQKLLIKCSACANESELFSSPKSGPHKPFDVNVRPVHLASSQGLGHAVLTQACASLDLPKPVNHKPFDVIIRSLSENAQRLAEQKVKDSAARLIAIMKKEEPKNVFKSKDPQIIANVAVTVDGT